jgi:hypothetical protein
MFQPISAGNAIFRSQKNKENANQSGSSASQDQEKLVNQGIRKTETRKFHDEYHSWLSVDRINK